MGGALKPAALGAIRALAVLMILSVGAAASASAAPRGAHRAYVITAGPQRDTARFVATYTGSGRWSTVYHAEPPNQGGNPDTNDAHDSSTQRWSLRFTQVLTIPSCGPRRHEADPCRGTASLSGATGSTSAAGRIAHRHVDGLFSDLDASVSCRVSAAPMQLRLRPTLGVRYARQAATISLTALIPVADALALLPGACPQQVDPIDGLSDNYFTPGFSFGVGYGPERWFASRTVEIPVSVFHGAAAIRIALTDTAAATPPKHCAIAHPSYERCTTGGSWTGVVTLRAQR